MSRARLALPLATLATVMLAGVPAAQSAKPAPSLCGAGETPLFQCVITGGRQVAVCAAEGGSPAVQYRFGAPGRLELAYPAAGSRGVGSMRWASAAYSGGGEMQIQFDNGGFTYVAYAGMYRTGFGADGKNNPVDELGVLVLRSGKVVSRRRCTAAPVKGGSDDWINEQATKAALPEGRFIYAD